MSLDLLAKLWADGATLTEIERATGVSSWRRRGPHRSRPQNWRSALPAQAGEAGAETPSGR